MSSYIINTVLATVRFFTLMIFYHIRRQIALLALPARYAEKSMKRHDVRPPVCPSMGPQQQDISIAAAAARKCRQCHVVSVHR